MLSRLLGSVGKKRFDQAVHFLGVSFPVDIRADDAAQAVTVQQHQQYLDTGRDCPFRQLRSMQAADLAQFLAYTAIEVLYGAGQHVITAQFRLNIARQSAAAGVGFLGDAFPKNGLLSKNKLREAYQQVQVPDFLPLCVPFINPP